MYVYTDICLADVYLYIYITVHILRCSDFFSGEEPREASPEGIYVNMCIYIYIFFPLIMMIYMFLKHSAVCLSLKHSEVLHIYIYTRIYTYIISFIHTYSLCLQSNKHVYIYVHSIYIYIYRYMYI